MEIATDKVPENAMEKREVKKVVIPWKRVCHSCGNKTLDEHETICLACGAGTRLYEGK